MGTIGLGHEYNIPFTVMQAGVIMCQQRNSHNPINH